MNTAAQINTLLSVHLAQSNGKSLATSIIPMLNQACAKLYRMGPWRDLCAEVQLDCSAGYFVLSPDYEAVVWAMVNDLPLKVNGMSYEYRDVGPLTPPVGSIYGLVDEGYVPLMSEIPTGGIDELIFTCTEAFASGDTATIKYYDSIEGYTKVVLPLHTITVAASGATAITTAADGGTDATTGEILTTLTITSSTGLVAGLGITLSQLTGTDATYIGTFRIHSIVSATSIKIVKSYVALAGTLAAVTTPRLMPVNTISSMQPIVYASLPARTLVKDADGVIYAILTGGTGVGRFRRYKVPQVPPSATGTWTAQVYCKRAWVPLVSTDEEIHMDNIEALKQAFMAVAFNDNGDKKRSLECWADAKAELEDELAAARGGAIVRPTIMPWGEGLGAVRGLYG